MVCQYVLKPKASIHPVPVENILFWAGMGSVKALGLRAWCPTIGPNQLEVVSIP